MRRRVSTLGPRALLYAVSSREDDDTAEEVVRKLYQIIEFTDLADQKSKSTIQAVKKLADIGLAQQRYAHDITVLAESKKDSVARLAVDMGKLTLVEKILCLALQKNTDDGVTHALLVLMKCYTDIPDSYRLVEKNGLAFIIAQSITVGVAKSSKETHRILEVAIFIAYNTFRHIDALPIGQSDALFRSIVEYDLYKRLMDLLLSETPRLSYEISKTAVEALAAFSDTEYFMDYAARLLDDGRAATFVQFYDACVVPLLRDPKERGKMLCFDDVLSWIRRARQEVEQ